MLQRHQDLTDEEYIELLRTQDKKITKYWWIWLALVIVIAGCLIYFVDFFNSLVASFDLNETYTTAGFILGTFLGFVFAGLRVQAAFSLKNFMDARSGYRTERLLLKYYDESKKNRSD